MPINTKYAGYEEEIKKVTRVRDFDEGSDAVKAKGEKYQPKLSGQSKDEYEAYVARTYLIPAVAPATTAISGSVTRKEPVFNPVGAEYLKDDFNGENGSVDEFISGMVKELLHAGGVGYLVEFEDNAITKTYTRESIINPTKDYIVLTQSYIQQDPKDKYIQNEMTEYLELMLDTEGNYVQNVWREEGKNLVIVDTITPTNRGEALKYIPFVYAGNGTIKDSDPMLLHLANINWMHYLRSAGEGHGLHWCTLPTGFVFGDLRDDKGKKQGITVGPGRFNHIDDNEARAEFLEFTGAGMGAVATNLNSLKSDMASVGAAMLTDESGGVKAAETARIDASSETATLSVIANIVDSTMDQLLTIIADWGGFSKPEFEANRDFIDLKLNPQELLAYLQVVNAGKMSLSSFLNLLVKGELLPKGITAKDEEGRIETGPDFDLEGDNEQP